jgi:dienelactone hydrolase
MDTPISRRRAIGALGALALPLPRQPVDAGDARPGPASAGLGNLEGAVRWIAGRQTPELSFLAPGWESLDAWKTEARPALLRSLSFDPERPTIEAATGEVEQRDGLRVESVRIRASPAYDIPARVLVPNQRSGRLPAVVALHCHGGQYQWGWNKLVSTPDDPPVLREYRERLYGRPYAEALARRGFVVVVIDAFYFGERRLRGEELDAGDVPADAMDAFLALAVAPAASRERVAALNRIAGPFEAAMAKSLFAAGATWPGLLTWDDRRTIDYLETRPDVDPDRIGCVGLSGGGLRAAMLAGADPRVRAACVTAWMTRWTDMIPDHARRHTWMAFTPGLPRALDLPDVASLLAPGALMVQQCARDGLFPMAGMRGALERIEGVYAKAGVPERFRGVFFDEPHSFTPAMQEDAFDWLTRWL